MADGQTTGAANTNWLRAIGAEVNTGDNPVAVGEDTKDTKDPLREAANEWGSPESPNVSTLLAAELTGLAANRLPIFPEAQGIVLEDRRGCQKLFATPQNLIDQGNKYAMAA